MSPLTSSTASTALVLLTATLLLLSGVSTAHNITRILEQYPDFSQFNALLTQTHLADVINRRKTLTVLALTSDRLGPLAGKAEDVVKRILSTHVILDYFDLLKLNKLHGNHNILTTLYQATGTADDQQGFLNVAHNQGGIFFGSAMKGAPIDAKLDGSVAAQPYNISVLSISHVIIAPGIDGSWQPNEAPSPKAAVEAPKTAPPAESPEDDLPADEPTAAIEAPVPAAEAPAQADAPEAEAPGPDTAPADANADNGQAELPANATGKGVVSGKAMVLAAALVSLLM